MKARLTLIFAALVVLLGSMVWLVNDRSSTAPAPAMATSPSVVTQVAPVAPTPAAPAPLPDPVAIAAAAAPTPAVKEAPMVHVAPTGEVKYVAREGDTISQLAIALLGSDTKDHRDAVIAANDALKSDPNRVFEGRAYSIAIPATAADDANNAQARNGDKPILTDAPASTHEQTDIATPPGENPTDKSSVIPTGPKLRYTAQPGDTVGVLAASLLGSDSKANRDTIIAANPSLKQDPDHLVAGQTYTIVAPNGLANDPNASANAVPTTQPDADEATRLSVGRTLRYTAKPGDTVSKLAVALLGSDTPVNRDLIIKSNPTLKQDPDHLVAGKTYWIAAPNLNLQP